MKKTNRSRKLNKVSRSFDSPAKIILEDKSTFSGIAIGARKKVVGEICFNTSMTGYQEIISDPSYAGQIINFTFPHIGNVGTNSYDNETFIPFASGIVVSADISEPSNFRSIQHLDSWLKENNIPGICNIDTRSITNLIRENVGGKIFITGNTELEVAVTAMKSGAIDYITKPIDTQRLLTSLSQCISISSTLQENKTLKKLLTKKTSSNYIFNSERMTDIYKLISKISPTHFNIFIEGESGVGKELIAQEIHTKSDRKGLFIPVDCGTLPENLIESELFGHIKGAFTDAYENKIGLFETANNGTLFLDEIGNLPLTAQSRLLRVIQDQTIKKVGDTNPTKINTRIIAATNMNMKVAIKNGLFREDLWHRLTEFIINVPPLRERTEDILPLSEFIISSIYNNKNQLKLSNKTIKALKNHTWPGNIRELKNCIHRAAILHKNNTIEPQDLQLIEPISIKNEAKSLQIPINSTLKNALKSTEKQLLEYTLKESNFNKLQASKKLGMYYASFCRKLKEHSL